MRRREFIGSVAGAAITWSRATDPQEPKMRTIGVLVRAAPGWQRFWKAFPAARREGQNIRRQLALRYRVPSVCTFRDFAYDGELMSYFEAEMYRSAAVLVDKVLKGAKPPGLPVEQRTRFELVINLKSAKALGLNVPPNLLALADQVIE